jgi:hypothetical protein
MLTPAPRLECASPNNACAKKALLPAFAVTLHSVHAPLYADYESGRAGAGWGRQDRQVGLHQSMTWKLRQSLTPVNNVKEMVVLPDEPAEEIGTVEDTAHSGIA